MSTDATPIAEGSYEWYRRESPKKPGVSGEPERLRDREVDRLRAELDSLKDAVQHLAAEAHRRKWVHEGNPAFSDFHRFGNELLAALAAPESHKAGEVCGDERPREFGDDRVITCTLPRHAAHQNAQYGTAWEYLRDDDAEAAVERVKATHRTPAERDDPTHPLCSCGLHSPCPTRRALDVPQNAQNPGESPSGKAREARE